MRVSVKLTVKLTGRHGLCERIFMTGASFSSPPWLAMTDIANDRQIARYALKPFLHRPFKKFGTYFIKYITRQIVFGKCGLSKQDTRTINIYANERSGRLS